MSLYVPPQPPPPPLHWQFQVLLFLFLHYSSRHTIFLYILLVEYRSCSPHCFPLGRGPPLGCRAEIRSRACRTASRRATIWATPHPNIDSCHQQEGGHQPTPNPAHINSSTLSARMVTGHTFGELKAFLDPSTTAEVNLYQPQEKNR